MKSPIKFPIGLEIYLQVDINFKRIEDYPRFKIELATSTLPNYWLKHLTTSRRLAGTLITAAPGYFHLVGCIPFPKMF